MVSQAPPTTEEIQAIAETDPVVRGFLDSMNAESSFYSFVPRPDDPANFDEQHSFCFNRDQVAFLIGGNAAGTTEAAAFKTGQFLLHQQPPPRKDTPFWIIADNYEQVMDVCWGEKLMGHGHIPECEVNWDRVAWHSEKQNRPKSVPLKPWPESAGGDPRKNWRLEFKSYEQGRQAMQAKSIGGFWFCEQFPLDIFLEVLRGCREYMFPGGQFAEFTPIDPELSIWVEKAMDEQPDGWKFYRANTQKNVPNLRDGWYEQFFALVPEEMRETRQTGALASFEGVIYPSFSPAIHTIDEEDVYLPPGAWHDMATDWGASAEHPHATVWGCRDSIGNWCFSGDMELLTQDGWKRFDEINGTETVATANIETPQAKLDWQEPLRYHKHYYHGKMLESQSTKGGVNFCVTPDHDMVLKIVNWGDERFKKIAVSEMPLSRNYRIPTRWEHSLSDDRDKEEVFGGVPCTRRELGMFLGLFIAEGYINQGYVCISQKSLTDKVEEVCYAFHRGWRRYKKAKGITEFRLHSWKVVKKLKELGMHVQSGEKFIPRFVFDWGEAIECVLEGYELGDGLHADPRGQRQLFTISSRLSDDLTEICARLGIPTKVSTQATSGKLPNSRQTSKRSICYRIYLRKTSGAVPAQLNLREVEHNDYVYCLTVPNGTLIVRRNRGTPFICGNCIYDEYWSADQTKITRDHVDAVLERCERWGWPIEVYPVGVSEHKIRELKPDEELRDGEVLQWRKRLSPTRDALWGMNYGDPARPGEINEFTKRGIPTSQARNSVYDGINEVRTALGCHPATGEPRIRISKRCKHLIEELRKYRWKRGKRPESGSVLNPQVAAPVPLKRDDDTADALRYLIYSKALPAGESISSTAKREGPLSRKSVQLLSRKLDRALRQTTSGMMPHR